MSANKSIGKAISYIRENKGITTQELADIVGVSQGSISMYENGKRNPSVSTLEKIAYQLETTVDNLLKLADDLFIEDNMKKQIISEESPVDLSPQAKRKLDAVYRNNDFVIELTETMLIAGNIKAYDLNENISYKPIFPGRRSASVVETMVNRIVSELLAENTIEIAQRLQEEMHHANLTIDDLVKDIKTQYNDYYGRYKR